ncbi:hypothetical protein AAE478_005615 [Parahypoxylon ruwenzoriense]
MEQDSQPQPQPLPQQPAPAASAPTNEAAVGGDQHCADHRRQCPFQDRPRLRWAFLVGLVVLVLAVLIVGVVFTVYYDAMYYSSGAFLIKNKGDGGGGSGGAARNEKIEMIGGNADANGCGQNQDSCEAYGQPNICCPAGMVCHSSKFSASGVFCCADGSQCLDTEAQPPHCDHGNGACGKHLGGGCCAPGTQCARDGCLKVYRAAPGFASSILSGTEMPPSSTTSHPSGTRTAAEQTPTATDGVTVLTTKIGETARSQGLKGIRPGFGFSGCPALELLVFGFALAFAYGMALGGD